MIKRTSVLLSIFSILLFAGTPRAAELKPVGTGEDAKASGTAEMENAGSVDCDRLLRVTAFGLKPDSIYSVWIVKKNGEKVPAGFKDKNFFKTNGSGAAHYTYMTSLAEIAWTNLEISFGPGGADGTGPVVLTVLIRP